MVSVAALLNPVPLESRSSFQHTPSPSGLSFVSISDTSNTLASISRPQRQKQKMVKDGAVFAKGKVKGTVNYPPFEAFDAESLRLVEKFSIWPNNGCMQEYARHIPYNSEKKSFLEKTGRESFEVFQYIFKISGEDKEFTVMWDYNIGLVRITPFFKCLKYSKTTPAKMLNLNPGLKEITHSITGGALAAQGYWMPYSCALAVCLTFCDQIAGALVPIFGPSFPSRCVQANSPMFGRMIVDSSIVTSSTDEAHRFRQHYSALQPLSISTPISTKFESVSPRSQPLQSPSTSSRPGTPSHAQKRQRLRLKRTFTNDSVYSPDTDYSDTNASPRSPNDRYMNSPITPASQSSYKPYSHTDRIWEHQEFPKTNAPNILPRPIVSAFAHRPTIPVGPSPWLSAIPRSVIADEPAPSAPWLSGGSTGRGKRVNYDSDADADYEGEERGIIRHRSGAGIESPESGKSGDGIGGAEKNAALLLMNLSVRDGERRVVTRGALGGEWDASETEGNGPRFKRRRAVSM